MQMLAFIKCFLSGLGCLLPAGVSATLPTILSTVELPFNPIKLILLVGWVYLCLYFVQRVQFSPLVPKNSKSIVNIATLFVGPLFLFVLAMVDMARKYFEGNRNVLEIITDQIQSIDSTIKLLDSSGKSVKQAYSNRALGLTKRIISNALKQRASDIIVEPMDESNYILRFKVDGLLRKIEQIEANACQTVVNSIKVAANMDISGKQRPQDGAFIAKTADDSVPFRVASSYVPNGEKLSIRILSQNASMFTLANIGLSEKQRKVVEDTIAQSSGMVLICGPAGSGKTTTLYAMLNKIDFFTHHVATVENPIGYVLPNANQVAVNPKAGITFANALRSILRQDPDVVGVDEIQDEETASIALEASKKGCFVLATIKSNSNASALIRLLDSGVPALLLSSGLSLVISQRLIRQLCSHCKTPAELSQSQINDFVKRKINYSSILQAKGCGRCYGTGYRGETAIFDILALNDILRTNIANSDLVATPLRKKGDKKGKSNLQRQGLKKVVLGITSLEELKRIVG